MKTGVLFDLDGTLADTLHSIAYFGNGTLSAFGLPPIRYLNKKRLEAAENLLLSTEIKVHEIALETGFDNTNHFIHLFKREYGSTPQVYREAHHK